MKYHAFGIVVVCFFVAAFDRSALVPKKGTTEYLEFIPGEYKLLSFLVDPISEETEMSLYDLKGKVTLKIRHKFDRLKPLTLRTRSVIILTNEVPHNDVSERKIFIMYFGSDENGNHVWSYSECVYVPRKPEAKNQKKKNRADFIWPILT